MACGEISVRSDTSRRNILKSALLSTAVAIGSRVSLKTAVQAAEAKPQIPTPQEVDSLEGRKIKRIKDLKAMSSMEAEHLISIDAPPEVEARAPFTLAIDMPNHPMSVGHHIAWIRVYYERKVLAFITFTPELTMPSATLRLAVPRSGTIDIVANCNIHGYWGMSKEIVAKPARK